MTAVPVFSPFYPSSLLRICWFYRTGWILGMRQVLVVYCSCRLYLGICYICCIRLGLFDLRSCETCPYPKVYQEHQELSCESWLWAG